jgi:2-dehydropantoate 2-reductase
VIMQDMWEKFIFLTSLAAMTCLMHAHVSEIIATPEGPSLMLQILNDCAATAAAAGTPPRPDMLEFYRTNLTSPKNAYSASMRRDLEQGYPVEADHIVGDMLARAKAADIDSPLLRTATTMLQCYQNARAKA